MKTKPFLLATAGSTVDGRTIDAAMLEQMASSYNPKTYSARVNIEHIRGISGQAPFRAYGDVLELAVQDVEVDFNGKKETRKGLFGVLDVTDEAKALNDAGQKVYPSIEIEPNFAGKGFAYCMGVALTDSPASIATDRLQFNRSLPGAILLSRGMDGQGNDAVALEFADAAAPEATGFLAGLSSVLDGFAQKFAPAPKEEPKPEAKTEGAAPFDFAALTGVLKEIGDKFAAGLDGLRTEFRTEVDQLSVKVKAVEEVQEKTPAPGYSARPPAAGNGTLTDC